LPKLKPPDISLIISFAVVELVLIGGITVDVGGGGVGVIGTIGVMLFFDFEQETTDTKITDSTSVINFCWLTRPKRNGNNLLIFNLINLNFYLKLVVWFGKLN
jgi:hypothetical protein